MNILIHIPGYLYDPKRHSTDNRTPLDLEENETPGYLPKNYWIEKTSDNENVYYRLPISKLFKEVKPLRDLTKAIDLVENFRNPIGDHMEWKIQCFLSQLLLTYGTGLLFTQDGAYSQSGIRKCRGKQPKNSTISQPVEAHIATLPTLITVSKDDYEKALLDGKHVRQIVFGDGSYVGRALSSAVSILPRCVNEADSQFEFKRRIRDPFKVSFREICIEFLNFSSKKKLDPKKGLKRYLQRAVQYLSVSKESSNKGYMKMIFEIYQGVVEKYLELLEVTSTFRKLTFTVGQKTWKSLPGQIQMKMTKEVFLSKKIEHLKTIAGKKEAKIILLSLSGSAQTLYYERIAKKMSRTAWKYLETCLSSIKFREECLDYLTEKGVSDLKVDWPSSELVVDVVKKDTPYKEKILEHALLALSREIFKVPEYGKNLRHFLGVNDSWAEKQLIGHYTLRDHIHLLKSDRSLKSLVGEIFQLFSKHVDPSF